MQSCVGHPRLARSFGKLMRMLCTVIDDLLFTFNELALICNQRGAAARVVLAHVVREGLLLSTNDQSTVGKDHALVQTPRSSIATAIAQHKIQIVDRNIF